MVELDALLPSWISLVATVVHARCPFWEKLVRMSLHEAINPVYSNLSLRNLWGKVSYHRSYRWQALPCKALNIAQELQLLLWVERKLHLWTSLSRGCLTSVSSAERWAFYTEDFSDLRVINHFTRLERFYSCKRSFDRAHVGGVITCWSRSLVAVLVGWAWTVPSRAFTPLPAYQYRVRNIRTNMFLKMFTHSCIAARPRKEYLLALLSASRDVGVVCWQTGRI